jgi:hypothetical protein
MDPRLDNEVIETFAVAASLEVIQRLRYKSFVETNEHFYARSLPPEVQDAIAKRQISNLRAYLRYRWRIGAPRPPDYSMQLIGAVILRSDPNFHWRNLLSVGTKGKCPVEPRQTETKFCDFNLSALPELRTAFDQLGIQASTQLFQRTTRDQPNDSMFAFHENGSWVSLLEVRTSDAMPQGFSSVH